MSEGEGTPAEFAAMLGRAGADSNDPGADARRAIAARHGLAPELGDRLRGETLAELEADAAAVAELVTPAARTEPETIEQRARRHLHAQLGLGAESKAEWARRFVETLHPPEDEDR